MTVIRKGLKLTSGYKFYCYNLSILVGPHKLNGLFISVLLRLRPFKRYNFNIHKYPSNICKVEYPKFNKYPRSHQPYFEGR